MKSREREVVLGAVVFIAIVIVVVGTLWLSENYAGAAGGYQLRVNFKSVPGLQRGTPVTIRGVKVGKVLEIELINGRPVVTLGFAGQQNVPRDSRILLKSEGLLGGQMIEVQPGPGQSGVYTTGDEVHGETVGGIEQVTADASRMANRLDQAMGKALSDDNLQHIEGLLRNMDGSARHLREMLEENQVVLGGMLDSLAMASGQTQQVVQENRADLRRAVENLKMSTQKLAAMAEHMEGAAVSLSEILDHMKDITGKVRDGEGTLGHLVYDDTVYRNLERTLTTVDTLLQDIKRDPTRYLKVDLHIF